MRAASTARLAPLALFAALGCSGALAGDPSAPPDASPVDRHDGGAVRDSSPAPDVSVDDGGDEAEAGPPAATPISAEPQSTFEAEDQIAVAPDGTIGIVWTSVGTPYLSLGYRFSTDDGGSFTPIDHVKLPAGYYPGDPAIATDAAGNFYAAMLGLHFVGQQLDQTRVYVAKAPHGSTAFGTPVEVSDPAATRFYDHPKVIVTAKGTIAVGFMQSDNMQAQTSAGIAATSPDGTTWSRATIVGQPDAQFANLFWFCEGAHALYATYLEASTSAFYVALRSSTDEGASWSTGTTVVSDANEQPAADDPGCVAIGDDVWIAYGTTSNPSWSDQTLDPAQALRVAHSGDGGHTIDPARIDALDTKASKLALLPVIAREAAGALDIAYIAGNADGDASGSVRFVRAIGTTFGASTAVDTPLAFTLSRTKPDWLGDYFGAAVHGKGLYAAYPINASGQSHIFFRRVALP